MKFASSLSKRFSAGLVVAAVISMTVAAPVWAQSREQQQTLAELRILEEQTQRLQQSVNVLVEQLKEVKDSVKAVNGRLDTAGDQTVKNTADVRDMINTLSRTVASLEQGMGENNVRTQQVEQELAPIRQGLTKLSDALTQALQVLPSGSSTVPAAGASTPDLAPPTSPADSFNQAMGFYESGQYDLAIKGFKNFLQQFPDSPQACKAQYQLGETHIQQNKVTDAIADYDVVIKQFKGTDCEPEAYFHQAKAYEQLKQTQKAVDDYRYIRAHAADKVSDAWQNADALARQALLRLNVK